MIDLLSKILGDRSSASKDVARERLKLVLVHDRAAVAPHIVDAMREDLIAVLSRYLEIDRTHVDVELTSSGESMALIASVPVRSLKRGAGSTR